ncbi:hypothetical protein [Sphingopyxis sp. C-1]|uniref:hypothetical protein n=1 Tax=Sphingopyxis sp. C-1 TaxID=262667 RepID=UPI0007855E34|nr:hypothetical protein [Sphingopyxis sp. C-1]
MMKTATPPRGLTADEWKAEMAFQVFCALRRAADAEPLLLENTYYDALLREVHSDFQAAFARSV